MYFNHCYIYVYENIFVIKLLYKINFFFALLEVIYTLHLYVFILIVKLIISKLYILFWFVFEVFPIVK